MADKKAGAGDTVVIKKYANRRLYNTATSAYVTLEDLAKMVRDGTESVVFDAKTNDDLTRQILTQIIFEEESRGEALLPVQFLRQLIGFYGGQMQGVLPSYLEMSLDSFSRQQEQMRGQFSKAFGAARRGHPRRGGQAQHGPVHRRDEDVARLQCPDPRCPDARCRACTDACARR